MMRTPYWLNQTQLDIIIRLLSDSHSSNPLVEKIILECSVSPTRSENNAIKGVQMCVALGLDTKVPARFSTDEKDFLLSIQIPEDIRSILNDT